MSRIFISDSTAGGTHGATVKAAILAANPDLFSADVTLQLNASYNLASVLADMETAKNGGYEAFVHCSGLTPSLRNTADEYWNASQALRVFVPLGSNSHEQLIYTPDTRPAMVTCGAGITQNETGYGNALWFFDDDNGYPGNASSFSTGVIVGKLLAVKDGRGCGWWEAIYAAAQTASRGGTPTLNDGYGIIDVTAAIAWTGDVPWDPYLPIGTVGTLTGSAAGAVATLTVAAVSNATEYYLERNTGEGWRIADVSPSRTFTVTLADETTTRFRYRAGNAGGLSEYSSELTFIRTSDMSAIRTQVVEAVKAALSEIDGTNGYATDFGGRIEVGRTKVFEQRELPAIVLKYANESPEVTDYFSTSGPTQKWNKSLPVSITICMDDNATYAQVDDAAADVMRKIGEDDRFGIANIEQTNPDSEVIADEQHEDFVHRGTKILVNIHYRTNQWQI